MEQKTPNTLNPVSGLTQTIHHLALNKSSIVRNMNPTLTQDIEYFDPTGVCHRIRIVTCREGAFVHARDLCRVLGTTSGVSCTLKSLQLGTHKHYAIVRSIHKNRTNQVTVILTSAGLRHMTSITRCAQFPDFVIGFYVI